MNLELQVEISLKSFFWDDLQVDFHDEKWDGKHFFLDITSEKFIGKSRIEQSRMVYACLDEFMKTDSIHALRMKCRVPE